MPLERVYISDSLGKAETTLKSGEEKLTSCGQEQNYSLLNFWRWSVSDILSNATRGRLAEFIVATATNIDIKQVRDEWGAYDLETPEGVKVEVKSAAYLQSWEQNSLSKISFSTKLSKPWDWEIDRRSNVAVRSADVYVFCLLHHVDKQTVNPLNMDQWEFYVLATEELNNYKRSQHSITLNSLRRLTKSVLYNELEQEIREKDKLKQKNKD